mmetsp:Transcript_16145/g.24334  ORF Transcript_16145/g.24334 Transcript_16145/m.24334 type:complete len:102 (-) Transcript_16145:115-420(-)|eukprot:CAMPEP_0185024024 /NCGR_PEP_ID=MMETSP1103-20130426/6905_1 /TAXON_ID=36769 /ORGANISM="Paraphysomonas bandaiensis, Strain Caron Lab Isolate" /LENGTH=101 /DNA_ID=CAMNT_0027556861 /DNA_START=184 /DNA_END=489 /DNA_ORIENTATION=-
MSKTESNSSAPVYVTATPVPNTAQHDNVTQAYARPATSNEAEYTPHAYPTAPVEESRVAVCRGCGREFTRATGVHSGQAQYYRCDECNGWGPLILGSCTMS